MEKKKRKRRRASKKRPARRAKAGRRKSKRRRLPKSVTPVLQRRAKERKDKRAARAVKVARELVRTVYPDMKAADVRKTLKRIPLDTLLRKAKTVAQAKHRGFKRIKGTRFRNKATGEFLSESSVRRRVSLREYWRRVRIVSDALGVSTADARKRIRAAVAGKPVPKKKRRRVKKPPPEELAPPISEAVWAELYPLDAVLLWEKPPSSGGEKDAA